MTEMLSRKKIAELTLLASDLKDSARKGDWSLPNRRTWTNKEEYLAAKYLRAGMLIASGSLTEVVLPSQRYFGVHGIRRD